MTPHAAGIGRRLPGARSWLLLAPVLGVWATPLSAQTTVGDAVGLFRGDPGERQGIVATVGSWGMGFVDGLRFGERIALGTPRVGAGPGRLNEAYEPCFKGWTMGQMGDWALQELEQTPEDWSEPWALVLARVILMRLGTAESC